MLVVILVDFFAGHQDPWPEPLVDELQHGELPQKFHLQFLLRDAVPVQRLPEARFGNPPYLVCRNLASVADASASVAR